MNADAVHVEKKKKVAWGITGCGDRLEETIEEMNKVKDKYEKQVDIRVYLSKAGEQVTKWYKLHDRLEKNFEKVHVEVGPNSPFLAGELQTGKFEFLLIAPATSNTVAKISVGVCDTLLCNSAIMALKANVPVYVMPSDLQEGTVITQLPGGGNLRLRVRKEDAENARKLSAMEGIYVLKNPKDIPDIFKKHFKSIES
jgi:archaeoflavoprotein AfpA